MAAPLNDLLDRLEDSGAAESAEDLLEAFTSWATSTGRPLYPHQEEALLELLSGNHVIAQTPTGSGKSLMAIAGHFISLARGGRSYYTAPLKALVSEKFFDLVDLFGAANVGMITGDVALNPAAPIICCTAEILANQALREGAELDTDLVIMDEFHFYSDPERGWAWQVPLLELTEPQFVLLSATLGDTTDLAEDMAARTGKEVALVGSDERPVPLDYEYCPDELDVVVERLLKEGRAPIYVVHFAQREAVETAKSLSNLALLSKAERDELRAALTGESFGRGFGKTLRELLVRGVGVHHAGMLPRYRRLVERLTQQGLLKVICGTDTLGVGINVPIRTVLFTSLVKFDGRRTRHLSAREFHQIAGRAGRAGFDDEGYVRVLASETEIEQSKHRARLSAAQEARDQKRLKKLARKKSPRTASAGKVTWKRATFDRLVASAPETLQSQFAVNHALVLNVLGGPGDPEERLVRLATENHDHKGDANPHLRTLGAIYQSLKQAEIVERLPASDAGPRLRVVADLPDEFALNQPLAPFALAALDLLDPDSPEVTLDVISVIEAVMDDPGPLLYAQQRAARDQAMQALRAEGADYQDRRDAMEEITWPRPLAEIIDPAFAVFAQSNPWVAGRYPSPKSVLREMIENAHTFTGLISKYDLGNAEGVVLRYLTDLYRALRQIPPARFQTEELEEIISWLEKTVRSVDSSLLDEWERLHDGELAEGAASASAEAANTAAGGAEPGTELAFGEEADGTISYERNPHLLQRDIRREVFRLVDLIAADRVDALAERAPALTWDEWDAALARYWAEHDWVATGADARAAELVRIDLNPDGADLALAADGSGEEDLPLTRAGNRQWGLVEQTLLDPNADGDWRLTVLVDLPATFAERSPVLVVTGLSPR